VNWKPRASSVGYYTACHYRAAFDRALAEGIAAQDVADAFAAESTAAKPHAALGTCIHFLLQDGLRCVWGDGKTSLEHAPTETEWIEASALFDADVPRTQVHAAAVAKLAARFLPKPGGGNWVCEIGFVEEHVQGHLDFLSTDGLDLWDLKTTSRRPEHGRIKPAHLAQICTYKLLAKTPTKGGILYVDALRGEWALPIPIDFTDPWVQEYVEHVESVIRFVRSEALFTFAHPQIGPTCSDDFCPYKAVCKDKFVPPAAETQYARLPFATPVTAGKVF
jgi:hypothetical protein